MIVFILQIKTVLANICGASGPRGARMWCRRSNRQPDALWRSLFSRQPDALWGASSAVNLTRCGTFYFFLTKNYCLTVKFLFSIGFLNFLLICRVFSDLRIWCWPI